MAEALLRVITQTTLQQSNIGVCPNSPLGR